jgi:hypothetical protein
VQQVDVDADMDGDSSDFVICGCVGGGGRGVTSALEADWWFWSLSPESSRCYEACSSLLNIVS